MQPDDWISPISNAKIFRWKLELSEAKKMVELINRVYRIAEEGIWPKSKNRITLFELIKKSKDGIFYIAKINDQVVGTVYCTLSMESILRFELLAVDQKLQKNGIGSQLLAQVEIFAKENGVRDILFELLTPTHWQHEGKEKTKRFYSQRGFKKCGLLPVSEVSPDAFAQLLTPAHFEVWNKNYEIINET